MVCENTKVSRIGLNPSEYSRALSILMTAKAPMLVQLLQPFLGLAMREKLS